MKIRTPEFEILAMTGHPELPFTYSSPNKLIEVAGRNCYKSESNITGDGARLFVEKIRRNKHLTVLEHSWEVRRYMMGDFDSLKPGNWNKYLYISEYDPIIVGNLRAFEEAEKQNPKLKEFHFFHLAEDSIRDIAIRNSEPYLMRATIRIVCDRGVSHEFVRHRPAAFSQESTRYVNYRKKEAEFIEPFWLGKNRTGAFLWRFACKMSYALYAFLLQVGWSPQEARGVLINSAKTEIIMSATLWEFQHIFNLRYIGTTGAPHPQMKEVMKIGLEKFAKIEPFFFGDIKR